MKLQIEKEVLEAILSEAMPIGDAFIQNCAYYGTFKIHGTFLDNLRSEIDRAVKLQSIDLRLVDEHIILLYKQDSKRIPAIKFYRSKTGADLKEGREYVDRLLFERLGVPLPTPETVKY